MEEMDEVTEQLILEVLNTEHNRLIASTLGQIEAHLGKKDARISRIVKDAANGSKRVMFTLITKTEVEPKQYGSKGPNSPLT